VERLRAQVERAAAPAEDGGARPAGEDVPAGPQAAGVSGATVWLVSMAAPAGAEGSQPGPAAGLGAQAASPSFDADAQLRQWGEQLEQINRSLEEAKAQKSKRVESATKALDQALVQFAETLKRRLADKAAPQLRQAWAADPGLRNLVQELAVKERHRNAALGGGLKKEAAELDGQVAELSARVEARRRELAAGSDYAAGVESIDQLVAQSRSLSGEERVRTDEQSMGQLAGWVAKVRAQGPVAAQLDADGNPQGEVRDEAAAARDAELEAQARALKSARQAYAAAASEQAPGGDAGGTNTADVLALRQKQARELAARMAARRVQLAAAQRDDRAASMQKLRGDLAAAQKRQADAVAAAERSAEQVRQLKADLAEARQAAMALGEAMNQLQAAEAEHKKQLANVEKLKTSLAGVVVPVDPGPDAVTVAPAGEDRRFLYMLIAGAAIVTGFSVLMLLSGSGGRGPVIPDRENPFDAPIVGATAGTDPNQDDERPVAV
jgi:hypothetical protein